MTASKESIMGSLFNSTQISSVNLDIPRIPSLDEQDSYEPDIDDTTQQSINASVLNPILTTKSVNDTYISITLDDVKLYDNNSRTSVNPRYHEIKDAIRIRGLDQLPTITKRPSDEHYMIMNGGNTRLQILKELYQETQQKITEAKKVNDHSLVAQLQIESDKYFRHEWRFKEYQSELDCFTGHVVENELRGETLFIDKAMAVAKFREYFSHENISGSRSIAEKISSLGWKTNHKTVANQIYTVEHLYPYIPYLLHSGLKEVNVKELRKTKNNYTTYINKLNNDSITDEQFEAIWQSSLAKNDNEDIKTYNILNIKRDLDEAIKSRTGVALFSTTSQIDSIEQKSDIKVNSESLSTTDNNNMTTSFDDNNDSSSIDFKTPINNSEEIIKNKSTHLTTESSNVSQSTTNNEDMGETVNPWVIVFNDAIEFSEKYQLVNCLSENNQFPGFNVSHNDSIVYSNDNQERIAIWLWFRSLSVNNSDNLLSESNITSEQAVKLFLYLSKARINNRKIKQQMTRIEKSILTVVKLLKSNG